MQKLLDETKKQSADMQSKYAALESETQNAKAKEVDENAQLKAELAELKAGAKKTNLLFSEGIEKLLKLHKSLGIDVDKDALLDWVTDLISGSSKMSANKLNDNYNSLVKQMSTKEQDAYDSSFTKLRSAMANKKVLKQNRSIYFVEVKKGTAAVKKGDRVKIRLA